MVRILIAGGGTGGHIYPGISVADEFRDQKRDHAILFVGTRKGMESELVPKAGYDLETITVSGFQRKLSIGILKSALQAVQGFFQAGQIISRFRPDMVIGTGGYVCGPVVSVARLRGIPTMVLEQNVIPGVTNRILGRFVQGVAVTYEASRQYFPGRPTIRVTGNPIRQEIMAADADAGRKALGIAGEKKVIMGFGGSIGAMKINQAMLAVAGAFRDRQDSHVLILTGKDKFAEVQSELKKQGISESEAGNVTLKPYLYNIQDAYAAAELVISRAGGISLSELTALGKPAIIIPYPHATNRHQDHNARHLEEAGAAVIIPDHELTGERLVQEVETLLNHPDRLVAMGQKSHELGRPNAAAQIVAWAETMVAEKNSRKK